MYMLTNCINLYTDETVSFIEKGGSRIVMMAQAQGTLGHGTHQTFITMT